MSSSTMTAAEAIAQARADHPEPAPAGPITIRRRSMPSVVIVDDEGNETTYETRMPSAEELAVAAEAVSGLQRVRGIRDLAEHVREALGVFLLDAEGFMKAQPLSAAVDALRQLPERYRDLSVGD